MFVSRDGETEIERLADLLEIRPGDTVADVGAGDGSWRRLTRAGLTHVTTADWPIAAHYAAVFRKER